MASRGELWRRTRLDGISEAMLGTSKLEGLILGAPSTQASHSLVVGLPSQAARAHVFAAVPLDVRKGSAFPSLAYSSLEAAPPEILRRSLAEAKSRDRKARGFPHIRRQSRFK